MSEDRVGLLTLISALVIPVAGCYAALALVLGFWAGVQVGLGALVAAVILFLASFAVSIREGWA